MYHNQEKTQLTIASLLPELSKISCLRRLNWTAYPGFCVIHFSLSTRMLLGLSRLFRSTDGGRFLSLNPRLQKGLVKCSEYDSVL